MCPSVVCYMYVCLDMVKMWKVKCVYSLWKLNPKRHTSLWVMLITYVIYVVINGVSITFLLGYFIYFSMRYIAYFFPMLKQICMLTKLCWLQAKTDDSYFIIFILYRSYLCVLLYHKLYHHYVISVLSI